MDSIIIQRPPGRIEFFSVFSSLPAEGKEMIGSAYEFSKAGHYRQIRKSGNRYFDHPKDVAWILAKELHIIDWQSIVDALLHDIREDTFLLSHQRIVLNFGLDCALDVDAVTHRLDETVEAYVERVFARGIRAILIKLCDRLNNMRTLRSMPETSQIETLWETRTLYIPLAERLASLLPPGEVWRAEYLKNQLKIECAKFP